MVYSQTADSVTSPTSSSDNEALLSMNSQKQKLREEAMKLNQHMAKSAIGSGLVSESLGKIDSTDIVQNAALTLQKTNMKRLVALRENFESLNVTVENISRKRDDLIKKLDVQMKDLQKKIDNLDKEFSEACDRVKAKEEKYKQEQIKMEHDLEKKLVPKVMTVLNAQKKNLNGVFEDIIKKNNFIQENLVNETSMFNFSDFSHRLFELALLGLGTLIYTVTGVIASIYGRAKDPLGKAKKEKPKDRMSLKRE